MQLFLFFQRLTQLFLAPPYCSFCKIMLENAFPLCKNCLSHIRYLLPTDIQLTKNKKVSVLALGAYEEPLASLIRAKQYRNATAAHQLGVLLASHFADWKIQADYIIPLPLHWRRYAWRGFNQAEIIAQEIGRSRKIPLAHLLIRTKNTAYQMTCSANQREVNVKDAFICQSTQREQYRGKHLIVVDDLMTTGATLESAAHTLLQLKPASITAIVACRVP